MRQEKVQSVHEGPIKVRIPGSNRLELLVFHNHEIQKRLDITQTEACKLARAILKVLGVTE